MHLDRRQFLNFLGRAGASTLAVLPFYSPAKSALKALGTQELPDDLILKPGYSYRTFLQWGEALNAQQKFGYNNDFVSFMPLTENEAFLFVNHEYIQPSLMGSRDQGLNVQSFENERKEVGFSCVVVRKEKSGWTLVKDHPLNHRVDASTPIAFTGRNKIKGLSLATGTLANCAGGQTPWKTFLSCEENYDDFVGDRFSNGKFSLKDKYGWIQFWDPAPEHYGWVVEYNPQTKESKKLTSLGRFSHEGALVIDSESNVVVYMADDKEDECIYKFISKGKTLEQGKLYVANTDKGEWLLLDRDKNPLLKSKFKTQTDVLTYTREASALIGASKLARPEDIKRDPISGNIFVALTSHKTKNASYGALLKITEKEGYEGMKFSSEIFLSGGPQQGFACPDNLAFDHKGNLWMTSDISEKMLGQDEYEAFKRNGLYYIPMSGKNAGKVELVAWGPPDAEISGPCFTPDGKLIVSVQHPGAMSKVGEKMTSHWPRGGTEMPRPSLVEISGRALTTRLA